MMMTSNPYFILMQPNTLHIINAVWKFRAETEIPLCFTLDAGANVHLLYPSNVADSVKAFIASDLLQFCQNRQCVHDVVGMGIKKC
jgi:diphosphomevalonate decarboxylase